MRALLGAIALLIAVASYRAEGQPPAAVSSGDLVNQYCVTCHSQRLKTGGLVLENLNVASVAKDAETWEKVVRKVRTGMMPPAGARRPERAVLDAFASKLEASLDVAATKQNPGTPALHRLNRNEYANTIRDLLALEVDPALLLPADDSSDGFDNIADVLGVSPALLERYVAAAAKISRLAVGDPAVSVITTTYRVRGDVTQTDHLEGLPLGTRGGIMFRHTFPLDAEYVFKFGLLRTSIGSVYGGSAKDEQLEVSVNGERVGLMKVAGNAPLELRLTMKAGPQSIAVAFLKKDSAAVDDVFQPFQRTTVDTYIGVQQEYTTVPHLANVGITGPYKPTGPGDTPSRRRIFTCQPGTSSEETKCAKQILSKLARSAYRRPVNDRDIELLLGFYQSARGKGTFETGIEMALRRILADPQFIFRFERDPDRIPTGTAYRISDLELASRLSFFLWSSIPDDELLDVASAGKLKDPAVLRQQTQRMLKDARSQSLVSNFAGQWLYLRELRNQVPDPRAFPDFDDNLRQAFQRETELFFQSIVREDRDILDLLDANYTFVDERLAKHYGIPNVYGTDFRRVTLRDDARRGVLGQGSILLVTSVANRTSPVSRGRWILENILGTPAPLPPPNVPPLKENNELPSALSVRERLEQHRTNPVCASCHKIMDPIGFALENFDAVGRWRETDAGFNIDASGQLVDGTKLNGPASLRKALLSYSEPFARTVAEKLLTYALGRTLRYSDMPVVRSITRDTSNQGRKFSALILGIVNSAPFQMKVKTALDSPRAAVNGNPRSSQP